MLDLRVLGSTTVAVDGTTVDLGGPRQRAVLALLLVARGEVVSVDRLIDDLWHGEPPPRALGALQAYVSNLRRLLEPDRAPRAPATLLVSQPPGYALRLADDEVDARRFEADLRDAAASADSVQRRAVLERALGRWRGPALAEFANEPWAQPEATRLEELRLSAREQLTAAALDAGDATAAALSSRALTREHPLREEGWRLLAIAQYTLGRQADALAALRDARTVLAGELGIDPGPALVALEADLLAQRIPLPPKPQPQQAPPAPRPEPVLPEPTGFVGRDSELHALRGAARPSRVALVSGEAGSGKSLLLERFRHELEAGGWRIAVGRCPETEGAPPAWAWVEVLRALTTDVDPGPRTAALAPLLDETRTVEATADDGSFGRFTLHRAVAEYLADVAAERPLAVFLDDLHRGDAETLAVLNGVTVGAGVFTVAAYRPDEVGRDLETTLAAVATATETRIRLGGLAGEHAAALVRSVSGVDADDDTVRALLDRTGGNPFYLRESARLLGSEGALVATSEVPEGVRDVLRRRFARLPEISVSVLRLAAVIGRDVDVDVLLRAAEVDEETVLEALDAGVVAGLLDEPAPAIVRFSHALVRDTLYGDLSRIRRARWHLRVAEAIASRHPDDAAALAHHFGESLSAGTARRAADYARAAAAHAEARFAHDAASAYYARAASALRRLPEPESAAELVDVLAKCSRSQLARGDSAGARESRDEAIEVAVRHGSGPLLVRALTAWDLPTPWINRPYGSLDRRLVDLVQTALGYRDLDAATRCRLLLVFIDEALGGVDDADVLAAGTEALALARTTDDPLLLGRALGCAAELFEVTGSPFDRGTIADELIDLGEAHDLPVLALMGHFARMQQACRRPDVAALHRHLARAEELADRYGYGQAQGALRMTHGFLAHLSGDLPEAEAHYLAAHTQFTRGGTIEADGIYLVALFTLRRTEGRLAELGTVLAGIETAGDDVLPDALALALVSIGDLTAARQVRERNRPIRADFFRSLLSTMRGMAVVAVAERDEAVIVYRNLLRYRGQIGGGTTGAFALGPVDTVLGDLATLLEDQDTAAEHYAAAAELADRCGNRYWADAARLRLQH